ncbi:phosphoenolpyruvate synthase [Fangia hongkongensis]|uniref:phosphoenolpyruvate synthase n=1 Tax=Fangia hongkongensis TaxID=270495 RepID=UPI000372E25A|nr:phosphoenolpyruvate synthase [Fangia hongkongensis]MBK2125490.1 phosphoenolpyruvate synthase [Fangia hongkongensis]
MEYVLPFNQLSINDINRVGGKNASLGEMLCHLSALGVRIPDGFATTADAYREFLSHNDLHLRINDALNMLDVSDVEALARTGKTIRKWIMETPLTPRFEEAVRSHYQKLCAQSGSGDICVAVRSSATAEDLPEASFAGQQETFLNITGIENVLEAIHKVFASLFTDRAISYRDHHGFAHSEVALSVGIQFMVRSDEATSGVMFSVDTESGFKDVVFITASYGLGEMVVQGAVNPDEYYVHKPTLEEGFASVIRRNLGSKEKKMVFTTEQSAGKSVQTIDVPKEKQSCYALSDDEVLELAGYAMIIEKHYSIPMDIEWAKDAVNGQLYIVQARPETVASHENMNIIERYHIQTTEKPIAIGRSIGKKIGSGVAKVVRSIKDISMINPGDVIVTDMTDPDWEPVMKIASAIVTNRGGRTCHAAIIAREIGVPAVVGCSNATDQIQYNQQVTVSCAEGDTGYVYSEEIPFELKRIDINKMPEVPFNIMMNIANPERAFDFQKIPNHGVGLARLEFIINNSIGYHPKALLHPEKIDDALREEIKEMTKAYQNPRDFYVQKLAEGIATLASAFYPKPVIARLSDFKSNEYANMIGGSYFEPHEENPMIGFRGASRYIDPSFQACFEMECEAVSIVRDKMGLKNLQIMIPFVRTLKEAHAVSELLSSHGLSRGKDGLKIIMMCEIPSNALLAEEFLHYFDGFSIGSNDMTQLSLGLDRDSSIIADSFDERDPAVKKLLSMAISTCNAKGKYIGICGQGPSDHEDFAKWLIDQGIHSISLNPDTVIETWLALSKHSKHNKTNEKAVI